MMMQLPVNGLSRDGNNFFFFWGGPLTALLGIELRTLCTRVKDPNHCAMLLLKIMLSVVDSRVYKKVTTYNSFE